MKFVECPDFEALTMGGRMRLFREEGELSIADIATYLERPEKVILDYENDVKLPSFRDLWLLCLLYYCTLETFCAPLEKRVFEDNPVALLMLKHIKFFDKFYYSNKVYVTEENKTAILAMAGYEIYPKEKDYYIL